jgi:inorganic pyrophosphatase
MWPTFNADGALHVVVETPRGSAVKFKYDPTLAAFTLSRPLTLGTVYPYDWGFVPSTRAGDGDPIDAMVLWDGTSFPGLVLPTRLIGLLRVDASGTTECSCCRSRHRGSNTSRRFSIVPSAPARKSSSSS